MHIAWDDGKNRLNQKKHGISFETAAHVFLDEYRFEALDESHSIDELGYITIGRVHNILFVVYTQRGDTTKLISARTATAKERSIYYGQFDDP